jgi:hypothetical protein
VPVVRLERLNGLRQRLHEMCGVTNTDYLPDLGVTLLNTRDACALGQSLLEKRGQVFAGSNGGGSLLLVHVQSNLI